MSNYKLTFDDVLIEPRFSDIQSRKDVSLIQNLGSIELTLPIISSNMDTITEDHMCNTMRDFGGIGCLHRFQSIEDNIKMFKKCPEETICSIGLGKKEQYRARDLIENGAKYICIDVAHGSQSEVAKQTRWLKARNPYVYLIVGNFASPRSIYDFIQQLDDYIPDAIKVGIGGGSACLTRIKTGIGYPQFDAIRDCKNMLRGMSVDIISDGGHRTSGDIAKALAAGANACMLGGMLSATYETPIVQRMIKRTECTFTHDLSKLLTRDGEETENPKILYRGSASKESYEDQNKDWDCAEGESFMIPYKGSVVNILKDIKGGLCSALSYTGSRNIAEFRENSTFIEVSSNSVIEGKAHGKGL